MSSTNVTILIIAAVLTVAYAVFANRVAPHIASYFARRLPHGDPRHEHSPLCHI